MTVFERIKKLANNQGKGVSKVALELGFSENLFYRWKNSEPKARDLEKVADYFDVSVDYLLGRTDDPHFNPATVDDEDDYEQELIMMFRKGEKEVAPEKRDLYRKQTKDLMSFISKTMRELDDEENE
ncbi:helix-turn-helix domain-containing protein [Enterococcus avium]|uniref:helix-turn-helix domain-containing protein n=1 Tax=Enterococcus avium TaxID=33945 RepID=UPI001C10B95B|nr:helix-turn-helix transcriptional regulator [Enterococcus avium]MBU5370059.1 helix-turn-helix domain-containing protein [Enterococcus avium]MDT2565177.1 helix-turn-helix transcriptional regulator [Enterococcus avium]